jgi:CrcB protein
LAKQKLTRQAIALAFFGGALGTLLRWSISEVLPSLDALWLVNILGALLVGFFAGHVWFKPESRRIFWSTGFAGGFTTMSAIAVLPLTLTLDFNSLAITVAGMVLAGFVAYWLGLKIATRMSSK